MSDRFKNPIFYTFGLYGAVGIQLAASVVAGLAFGNWLDNKLTTSPWLALLGTILGAIGGIWNLVRILKWNEQDHPSRSK